MRLGCRWVLFFPCSSSSPLSHRNTSRRREREDERGKEGRKKECQQRGGDGGESKIEGDEKSEGIYIRGERDRREYREKERERRREREREKEREREREREGERERDPLRPALPVNERTGRTLLL